MFGYVTIRKDDLKVKDYNKYQAYYCGLCQDIKEAYGKKGQAMLTFDMTFLSILLTGLYECETKEEEHFFIPAKNINACGTNTQNTAQT